MGPVSFGSPMGVLSPVSAVRAQANIVIISIRYPDFPESSALNVRQDNVLLLDIPVKRGKARLDPEGSDNVTMLSRPGQFLSLHFPKNSSYHSERPRAL